MNDWLAFAAFCLLECLVIFAAYQCGYAQGLRTGFSRGHRSANKFTNLKRTAENQINGRN
jgi:hypothetical protein